VQDPAGGPGIEAAGNLVTAIFFALAFGAPILIVFAILYVAISVYKNRHRRALAKHVQELQSEPPKSVPTIAELIKRKN